MTFYTWNIIAIIGLVVIIGLCEFIPAYVRRKGKKAYILLSRFASFLICSLVCFLLVFYINIIPPIFMIAASVFVFLSDLLCSTRKLASVFAVTMVIICTSFSIWLAHFLYG